MKIILFGTPKSTSVLRQMVEAANHIVVAVVSDSESLPYHIARTTPHGLIAHLVGDETTGNSVWAKSENLFPDIATCTVRGDLATTQEQWQQSVQEFLNQPHGFPVPRPYAEGTRIVWHDASLKGLSSSSKLNRPTQEVGWEEIAKRQEGRFLLMLEAGKKNHTAAQRYYRCLLEQREASTRNSVTGLPTRPIKV